MRAKLLKILLMILIICLNNCSNPKRIIIKSRPEKPKIIFSTDNKKDLICLSKKDATLLKAYLKKIDNYINYLEDDK